jgi:MFS family permease
MIGRFSLYGFLKNQRYFEPFLLLVFLEKGLDFLQIGLLISFRELAINVLEIPSGAIADLWGRRRAMILSFCAYILSFALFAGAQELTWLFAAMALFAVGEAFRTGTHKAMIFAWLKAEGREQERTKVYGYTRSWSKYGSALSVILAAVVVYVSQSYAWVFALSILPYVLGVVNFLGYPAALDGARQERSLHEVAAHLRRTFSASMRHGGLRRLMAESMGFQGVYEATKDYLQPALQAAALAAAMHWSVAGQMSEIQRTTLLIGPVYLVLYLISANASRQAHRLAGVAGDEERAARWLWGADALLFAGLGAAAWVGVEPLVILAFVVVDVMLNVWRPIHLGRFDRHGEEEQGATLLSIESQVKRLATVIVAPLLGWAIDTVSAAGLGGSPLWPVGVVGLTAALLCIWLPVPAGSEPES